MPKFSIAGRAVVEAEDCIDGVLLNPVTPAGFMVTPNDERSATELLTWWRLPYVCSEKSSAGTVYTVMCLDGGAWDRPTWVGFDIPSLADAVALAKSHREAYINPVISAEDLLARSLTQRD